MSTRNFITIYTSLSKQEKYAFTKFVKSPYFNENNVIMRLNFLLSEYPADFLKNINTDELICKAHGKESLTEEMKRRISSDFNKLLKKFLLINEIGSNNLQESYYLLKSYRKRFLDNLFQSETNKIEVLLSDSKQKSREYYNDRIRIKLEELLFSYTRGNKKYLEKTAEDIELSYRLINISLSLITFISSVTSGTNFNVSKNNVSKISAIFQLIEANREYYKSHEPNIYANYLLAKLFVSQDDNSIFLNLQSYAAENFESFNDTVNLTILVTLFKYCIYKFNEDEFSYLNNAGAVLDLMKENKTFEKVNEIQSDVFLSVILVALDRNQIDYANYFIENFYIKLNPFTKNDIVMLSKAIIYFKENQFDKVIKYLTRCKAHDAHHYILIKSILFETYFELNEFRYIYPIYDSLKHFLKRRNELSQINIISVNKLLDYGIKLSRIKQNDGKNIDKLLFALENEQYFFHKNWLMEKSYEILKLVETE